MTGTQLEYSHLNRRLVVWVQCREQLGPSDRHLCYNEGGIGRHGRLVEGAAGFCNVGQMAQKALHRWKSAGRYMGRGQSKKFKASWPSVDAPSPNGVRGCWLAESTRNRLREGEIPKDSTVLFAIINWLSGDNLSMTL